MTPAPTFFIVRTNLAAGSRMLQQPHERLYQPLRKQQLAADGAGGQTAADSRSSRGLVCLYRCAVGR